MKANRLGAALVSVIGAVMLGGCGWTARDTYRDARKVSFTAARGDRSVIVFSPESSWPSPAANPSLADAR